MGVGAGDHRRAGPDGRPRHPSHRHHDPQPPPRRAVHRSPQGRQARRVEKPLAGTLADARRMAEAAAGSSAQTFVWYSYRRVPALESRPSTGRRRSPRAPLPRAGGLPAGLGRGQHPLPGGSTPTRPGQGRWATSAPTSSTWPASSPARRSSRSPAPSRSASSRDRPLPDDPSRRAPSTVDDTVLFLARFSGGAVATFEATRLATGVKNSNRIEVHGELGALAFDFTRMNELGSGMRRRRRRGRLDDDPDDPMKTTRGPRPTGRTGTGSATSTRS